MALDILVVDDEADIRELVAGVLEDDGYSARVAADSDAALAAIADRRPSLVLLDVWLKGSRLDGLDLLDEIKRRDASLPVLVISGHGNLDTAVAAIRRGAADFIEKPFEAERLLLLVARATETERLKRENEALRARIGFEDELTGSSGAINSVRATVKRVAPTGSRVLFTGPAGVGKEVAARLLHNWSPRAAAPFIVGSAARMTPERVEEELFGIERNDQEIVPGLLERAHGGTLFLDEIADMPLTTQGRILRVLTDQSFVRVSGTRNVKVDVRVVSATSRDLQEEITAGRFREDFYYRLNVVTFLRFMNGVKISPPSPPISRRATPQNGVWPHLNFPTSHCPRFKRLNGQAMSANCATLSNVRSFSRQASGCARLKWICYPPKSWVTAIHRDQWPPTG
jgi:two-component system, NtrC family, nitrogen regulation response regulator NtrX